MIPLELYVIQRFKKTATYDTCVFSVVLNYYIAAINTMH